MQSLDTFIEEQASRLYADFQESLQFKSDKAAKRFSGFSDLSDKEQYDLGTDIMRSYCDKLSNCMVIKNKK